MFLIHLQPIFNKHSVYIYFDLILSMHGFLIVFKRLANSILAQYSFLRQQIVLLLRILFP